MTLVALLVQLPAFVDLTSCAMDRCTMRNITQRP
jgi:hypothetical protein